MQRAKGLALAALLVLLPASAGAQSVRCGSLGCASATVPLAVPFGYGVAANIGVPSLDTCACWLFSLPQAIGAVDTAAVQTTASDADDTVQLAVFDVTGQTKVVQATVNVAAAAGLQASANTATLRLLPAGAYWLCLSDGQGGGATAWNMQRPAASGTVRTYKFTTTCTAGVIPATVDPSGKAISNGEAPPAFQLTDD